MYLNKIRLKNWKNIQSLDLDLSTGINILFGRNEIGKSTIIEAIRFAFLEKSDSSAKETKNITPWGTSLKGEVEIQFTTKDNKIYSIYKSFPKGDAKLSLITDSKKIEMHNTLKKVQQELLTLLGISEIQSNLFNLLWIDQGKALDIFKNNPLSNEKFNVTLKNIIKENIVSKESEEFYNSLIDEKNQILTDRNKYRKSSLIYKLQHDEEILNRELEDINKNLESVREKQSLMERLNKTIKDINNNLSENNKILKEMQIKKKLYDKKFQEYKLKEKDYEKKRELFKNLEKNYRNLITLDEGIKNLQKQIKDNEKLLKSFQQEDKLVNSYRILIEKENKEKEYNNLTKKIENYNKLQKQISDYIRKRDIITVKDENIVNRIKELLYTRGNIRTRIESALIKTNISSLKNMDVQIKIDSNDKKFFNLKKGNIQKFHATEKIEIHIRDFVKIDFLGPTDKKQLDKLNKELQKNNLEIEKIYNKIGLNKIDEIEKEYKNYKNLNEQIRKNETEMKRILGDYSNIQELKNIKNRLKDEIENFKNKLKTINVVSIKNRFHTDSFEIIEKTQKKLQDDIHTCERSISSDKSALQEKLKNRTNILDKSTSEKFKEKYFKQNDELKYLKKELLKLKPDEKEIISDKDIEDQLHTIDVLKKEKSRNENEFNQMKGALKELMKQDLLNKKAETEFKLNEVLNKLKNERVNIYSIKLLLNLIEREKASLYNDIVFPLQERLSGAFSEITDSRYSAINIKDDFRIAQKLKVQTISGEFDKDVTAISYGTKEQLSFLFRFTVAQFLSKKESQIMILDDSFVNTDYHRLEKIIKMINKFSDKIQFLVFAWNKENYSKFNKIFQANFINLETMIH